MQALGVAARFKDTIAHQTMDAIFSSYSHSEREKCCKESYSISNVEKKCIAANPDA